MFNDSTISRRSFVLAGVAGAAAASLPLLLSRAAVAAEGNDMKTDTLGAPKQVRAGVLEVGYYEIGPSDGPTAILLHGFPYDIQSYREVAPLLASKGIRVIVPHLRGHGNTRFLDADIPRAGQQAAIGRDLLDLVDALKIKKAVFAGYDWGGRAACVAAALWPDRCSGLVSVNGYLIQDIAKSAQPAPAGVERGFWYQFYFQTERGRAGLEAHRKEIAEIMWHDNSPTWRFDKPTFERSAASFENPDYVDVVIHSYRHRLGGASGYPEYAELERRLAQQPVITVPTVTLDGDSDGVVAATDGTASANKFSAKRVHRVVKGVGHNLPQEAPLAFADAVLEVASLT
ncbi:alpha/beta fold hydrolase [Agrobacterium pusense]|uniref:alpha/beta fold hydrolase n=1 Tax=Agrobacterium TaxID=357 RepID=UPI000D3D160C|nr:alpha/beta hydrolase [Agrobacterium pusense]